MAQGNIVSLAYGFNGYVQVFPQPIVTTRNPVSGANGDSALNGQLWINTTGDDAWVMVNASTSTWQNVGGGAGTFTTLTVTPGPTNLTGALTVTSGTQAVNISTDAAANTVNIGTGAANKTVNLGSGNTNSTTTVRSGTGGSNLLSTGTVIVSSNDDTGTDVIIDAIAAGGGISISSDVGGILVTTASGGAFAVATGTGAVNISNDATATTVRLGTGAGGKTVLVGSTNTNSTTTVQSGTGGVFVTSTQGLTLSSPAVNGVSITNGTQTAGIFVGTGAPGINPAPKGSLYINTTATTTTTRLYINTDGAGTWTNFTTAA